MKQTTMDLLEKYNQTHLLKFYDQLSPEKQDAMETQLEKLDWGVFDCFGNDNTPDGKGKIEPVP